MNTNQIQKLLKNDLYAQNVFKKACTRDQLQHVTYPSAYIINTHPSSKPGEHWIAVHFDKNGEATVYHLKFLDLLIC